MSTFTYQLANFGIIRSDNKYIPITPGNEDYDTFISDCVTAGLLTQENADNNQLPSIDNVLVFPYVKPLEEVRQEALANIDLTTGTVRLRYITDIPGQDMVYQEKHAQAVAFVAANYPTETLSDYPFIQVEAAAKNITPKQVADTIIATKSAWVAKSAEIEQIRITGKLNIIAATTVEDIEQARSAAATQLVAIV